jgi:hypothetical protein
VAHFRVHSLVAMKILRVGLAVLVTLKRGSPNTYNTRMSTIPGEMVSSSVRLITNCIA